MKSFISIKPYSIIKKIPQILHYNELSLIWQGLNIEIDENAKEYDFNNVNNLKELYSQINFELFKPFKKNNNIVFIIFDKVKATIHVDLNGFIFDFTYNFDTNESLVFNILNGTLYYVDSIRFQLKLFMYHKIFTNVNYISELLNESNVPSFYNEYKYKDLIDKILLCINIMDSISLNQSMKAEYDPIIIKSSNFKY
jgi:hypothetical protein